MKWNRLIALLLAANLLGMPALAAEETPPATPQVIITGTQVTKTNTVEVGVEVSAADFKSVSVVLRYDASKLEPVRWDKDLTTVDVAQADGWSGAAFIPSKGSDALAGKPALAYLDATDGGTGYLYLSADARTRADFDGRAITVRFRCVGEGKATDMTVGDAEADTVTLAPLAVANGIAAASVSCTTTGADGTLTRYAHQPIAEEADGTPSVDKGYAPLLGALTWSCGPGRTIAASEGTADALATVFLDWDGSIMKVAPLPIQEDVTQAVAELRLGDTAFDAALKAKAGYDFDCWLNYDAAKKPATSNRESVVGAPGTVDLAHLDKSFQLDNGGVVLQAAYKANGTLKLSGSEGSDYYIDLSKIQYDRYGAADGNSGQYSMTYTVKRQNQSGEPVERLAEAAAVVSMIPKSGGQAILSLITLDSTDEMTFEIVPTKDVASVRVRLIDTGTVSAWPNAGSRSGDMTATDVPQSTYIREGTLWFIHYQAVLQNEGSAESQWNYVDSNAFYDATGISDLSNESAERVKTAILEWAGSHAESLWNLGTLKKLIEDHR